MNEMRNDVDDDMLRVEVRFKNARLYDAIVQHDLPVLEKKSAAGTASSTRGRIKWFCDFYRVQSTSVYDLLNLKRIPYTKSLNLRALPQRLCGLLEKDPEWLFPVKLYEQTWRPMVRHLSEDRVQRILNSFQYRLNCTRRASLPAAGTDAIDVVANAELAERMDEIMNTLPYRDRQVLTQRFGLDGGDEHTLKEVGQQLGVTGRRVHQIELRALRRMRHPSRSKRLKGFLPRG